MLACASPPCRWRIMRGSAAPRGAGEVLQVPAAIRTPAGVSGQHRGPLTSSTLTTHVWQKQPVISSGFRYGNVGGLRCWGSIKV